VKDLARVAALVVAVLVLVRSEAVAGPADMRAATAVAALVVLAALTLWRDGFVTAGGAALAAHYGIALVSGHVDVDLGAPVMAALVVAFLDLLDLADSLPRDRRVDRAFLLGRLRHVAVVVTVAAGASAAAFAVALLPVPSSEQVRVLGLAGAAAAIAVPLGLLRARR
jgi:hypothetical protein